MYISNRKMKYGYKYKLCNNTTQILYDTDFLQ